MAERNRGTSAAPRYGYGGIDRVIHEHARLSVLTSLVAHPQGLAFGALKQLCGLTDGNLNRHLQVLEHAKLVSNSRGIERKRPQTTCRITAAGRKRYFEYLGVLEQIILDAAATAAAPHRRPLRRQPQT